MVLLSSLDNIHTDVMKDIIVNYTVKKLMKNTT